MDEDAEMAAWHQREQELAELMERIRKDTAGFRAEIDGFTAEFNRSLRSLTKGKDHADSSF